MTGRLVRLAAVLALALTWTAPSGPVQAASGDASPGRATLNRSFGQMPLYFIENRGQLDSRVAYYVQGRDTTLYFSADGMTLALTDPKSRQRTSNGSVEKASLRKESDPDSKSLSRWAVKLDFVGANPHVKIVAGDPTPAVVSYFKGRREQWKAGLSTYGSIVYSDLWPGIDLVYSGTANRLKYTFLVKPGADPAQVRLAYRGVRGIRVNDAGELEVETPAGDFSDDKPYAYQEVDGRQVAVDVGYALDPAEAGGAHRYGFEVGSYDRGKPLVLDPAVFVYCGYIGGNGSDAGRGIAVDSSGNAYVTGYTNSSSGFPVTVGPDTTFNGFTDAFVAKVRADGTGLVYCGYIGGNSDDQGFAIAVDSSGNAYVTGWTHSTETTFPVTVGPGLHYKGGTFDAFVAKVNAAGTALVYCGYIGGSGDDESNAIAVDGSGNAYVTGRTDSTESTFPVTVGPDTTFNGGGTDAFVAKVRADGIGLAYCGYIGGSGSEYGNGIAVDSSGNAYVTGATSSTQSTFPVTVGPDTTFNGGLVDVFVAKVKADGTGLVYCGYIGGNQDDIGSGIAVDSSGNAYVTGVTSSTQSTFPVTVGPDTTYNGGPDDAFVAKVKADGTGLVYCGYIGGTDIDMGNGIAVDGSGNAYVTGGTLSTEVSFPVTGGPDPTYGGSEDGFIAKVKADGTGLVYCGYIGGVDQDYGNAIAVDGSGNAYVTGGTSSTQATFPVIVGPDLAFNGGTDAFVAKISEGGCPTITLSPATLPDGTLGRLYSQTITASGGTGPYTFAVSLGTLPPGLSLSSGGLLSGTPTATGTSNFTIRATDAHQCTGTRSYSLTVASGVTVTSILPRAGPISGGRSVVIMGAGFLTGATVTLCTSSATNVAVINSTTITAITPAHPAGLCTVTVTNPGGAFGSLLNGYRYMPPTLFTDDPLIQYSTVVKAQHILELRTAIGTLRSVAGLMAPVWTYTVTVGVVAHTVDVQEMRTQLDPALTALGYSTSSYTDPTLTPGVTLIKKVHIDELRNRIKQVTN